MEWPLGNTNARALISQGHTETYMFNIFNPRMIHVRKPTPGSKHQKEVNWGFITDLITKIPRKIQTKRVFYYP